MTIRAKIVLLVMPLIIAPLVLTGFVASLSARNGITSVATSLLRFKMDDLLNYSSGQWSLLVENNFVNNRDFVAAARSAAETYARSLVRRDSELIFALDGGGNVAMSTAPLSLSAEESAALAKLGGRSGWESIVIGGIARVAETDPFPPFGWQLFVTEKRGAFYQATTQIFQRTGIILTASLAVTLILLIFFAFMMTKPLRTVVAAMQGVIVTNDLTKRVEILYRDETGDLGHSFNLMTERLSTAYGQIKAYALNAAIAQHNEQSIRNIFQKFVPKDVIDQFFANPESMLVGQQRTLAVLFSDIRNFTGISEKLLPAQVVESLNGYFGLMVEIILNRKGIVDKYIGDAVMAFFGAPVFRGDEAYQSVMSGLEMLEALESFNASQLLRGLPPFAIGIGINYGNVVVGNIGSDKKMDYTVIGDMVNVASRLEGLTKVYKQGLIISENLFKEMKGRVPCREIDRVLVKGRTAPVRIYAPKRELTDEEARAWEIHHTSLILYYRRNFTDALQGFRQVCKFLPADVPASIFAGRCERHIRVPPNELWTGAETMTDK